jgi:hypothetical protein
MDDLSIFAVIISRLRWPTYKSRKTPGDTAPRNSVQQREPTMKKAILTAVSAALVVASTMQIASAAERHHVRHAGRATVSEQFRNANNAVFWPAPTSLGTEYSDGHAISAPAGR